MRELGLEKDGRLEHAKTGVMESGEMASLRASHVSVIFFFQAEDGIRDLTVTGVQTCALPIFRSCGSHSLPRHDVWPQRGFEKSTLSHDATTSKLRVDGSRPSTVTNSCGAAG